jgi:O-acetyl-ADP-ribose deacetylase (regulator of RNase III)
MDRIKLIRGDITKVKADAIVNAANTSLLGGGGVDGAIHKAAGPALLEACRQLNGCPPGEARITVGFKLWAAYIIHTPGPVWSGGNAQEEKLLASSYLNSLKLASEYKCRTVAFPNISTGVYGFPKENAAEIAISTTRDYLLENDLPGEVWFVCFDEENYLIYQNCLNE